MPPAPPVLVPVAGRAEAPPPDAAVDAPLGLVPVEDTVPADRSGTSDDRKGLRTANVTRDTSRSSNAARPQLTSREASAFGRGGAPHRDPEPELACCPDLDSDLGLDPERDRDRRCARASDRDPDAESDRERDRDGMSNSGWARRVSTAPGTGRARPC